MDRISQREWPVSNTVRQKLAELTVLFLGFGIKTASRIREVALSGPKRETATPATKCRPVHLQNNRSQDQRIKKGNVESIVGGVNPVVGELRTLSQAGRMTDMLLV
jgi:hypothetical protein